MYGKYSVQGQRQNGSYLHTVVPYSEKKWSNPSEKYSFIAVNAGLRPVSAQNIVINNFFVYQSTNYSYVAIFHLLIQGPKAPWNFYGKVSEQEFVRLEEFEKIGRASNGTIWFGHYPTSFIITKTNQNIRNLMSQAAAYLCGHLHTAYGMAEHMYTVQHSGLLELELADFKISRRYFSMTILSKKYSILSVHIGFVCVSLIMEYLHSPT